MPRPLASLETFKNIAYNVRLLRTKKKMSQESLGKMLEISKGAVHHWETYVSLPSIDILARMADIFEVSMDDLCRKRIEIPANDESTSDEQSGYCCTGPGMSPWPCKVCGRGGK